MCAAAGAQTAGLESVCMFMLNVWILTPPLTHLAPCSVAEDARRRERRGKSERKKEKKAKAGTISREGGFSGRASPRAEARSEAQGGLSASRPRDTCCRSR